MHQVLSWIPSTALYGSGGHPCNPSTQVMGAAGSNIQGHLQLQSKCYSETGTHVSDLKYRPPPVVVVVEVKFAQT